MWKCSMWARETFGHSSTLRLLSLTPKSSHNRTTDSTLMISFGQQTTEMCITASLQWGAGQAALLRRQGCSIRAACQTVQSNSFRNQLALPVSDISCSFLKLTIQHPRPVYPAKVRMLSSIFLFSHNYLKKKCLSGETVSIHSLQNLNICQHWNRDCNTNAFLWLCWSVCLFANHILQE